MLLRGLITSSLQQADPIQEPCYPPSKGRRRPAVRGDGQVQVCPRVSWTRRSAKPPHPSLPRVEAAGERCRGLGGDLTLTRTQRAPSPLARCRGCTGSSASTREMCWAGACPPRLCARPPLLHRTAWEEMSIQTEILHSTGNLPGAGKSWENQNKHCYLHLLLCTLLALKTPDKKRHWAIISRTKLQLKRGYLHWPCRSERTRSPEAPLSGQVQTVLG